MLRVKVRDQLKIFLLLLSVFFTIPSSYARDVDPCDEIVGNWTGTWNFRDAESHRDVTAIGTKYKDRIRLEVNYFLGPRRIPASDMIIGSCYDGNISVTNKKFEGTIFENMIEFHGPYSTLILHKKNN